MIRFKFVAVSNPMNPGPTEQGKSEHSHIMRQVHANKRRLKMRRYQRNPTIDGEEQALTLVPFLQSLPAQIGGNSQDPFSATSRPLSSEEWFLLDHYIKVVMPFSIGHCKLFNGPGDHRAQMLQEWVGLAITDDAFMAAGILLSTCRYILARHPNRLVFTTMLLQYKSTCIEALRHEVSDNLSQIKVTTVAKALALAIDEANSGNEDAARYHLHGIVGIVQAKGGAESLALTDLLRRMYNQFEVSLKLTNTLQSCPC